MKKYQIYWLTVITLICLLSLTLSVCSVIDYSFCADSFIGIVGTYIGIAVTLIIGYQIFNIIEFREELKVQKRANDNIIEKKYYSSEQISRTARCNKQIPFKIGGKQKYAILNFFIQR